MLEKCPIILLIFKRKLVGLGYYFIITKHVPVLIFAFLSLFTYIVIICHVLIPAGLC
jgi:hypothetical protein